MLREDEENMAGIPPQLGQMLMNALPAIIGAGQNAAQNLQQSYKQAVEIHMQKKKELENMLMQDMQKKRESERKLFEQLRESNKNRQEKQQSIGDAWAKALGMSVDWGSE